jgi:hypothetical protein
LLISLENQQFATDRLRNLVQQGLSVEEIAERFRKTPEQIQSWNDEIRAENPLKRTLSGRFLRPPRPTGDDPDVRGIFDAARKSVEAGEAIDEVARKAGIDVGQLRGYVARANVPIGPKQPWDSLVEKLLAARAAGNYLDVNIDMYRGRIRNMLRVDGRAEALALAAELDKRFGI